MTWGINVSRWQPNQKQSNEYISDKRYYTLSVSCSCLWKFRRKGMWLKKWGWLTLTEFRKLEIACSTFKVKSIFAFHFWETKVSPKFAEVLKCNIVTLKKERKNSGEIMKCFYVSFAVALSQVFLLTFFCGTRKARTNQIVYLECMWFHFGYHWLIFFFVPQKKVIQF